MNIKKDVLENVVGLIIVLVIIFVAVYFFNFDEIQTKIISAGAIGPLILILLKASTIVFAPLSGSPLYPISGAIFGFWNGLFFITIGDILGSVIAFLISRRFGQKLVERMLHKKNMPVARKIIRTIETTQGFLFARVCFSAMPEIVAYAGGLTKLKFSKFIIINTLVGLIPAAILVFGGNFIVLLKNPLIMGFFVMFGIFVIFMGSYVFYRFSKQDDLDEVENDSEKEKDLKNI